MDEFIERMNLFPTPVWKFKYSDFSQQKDTLIKHLTDDSNYFTKFERNGLQTTDGNLHCDDKHSVLFPLRDFMVRCFEEVMDQLGYEKDVGITTMWATRQRQGGHHHFHIHKNTFLAGVFYLYDATGNAHGLTLQDDKIPMYQIQPRVKNRFSEYFSGSHTIPFDVGTMVIFPSWVQHYTQPNPSTYRVMIGANVMPVGRSNADHFSQYNFIAPEESGGYLTLQQDFETNGYGR